MIQQNFDLQERYVPPTLIELRLKENTDCFFVYGILLDGQWHNVIDIMAKRSITMVNWSVRSRISDLKKKLIPFGFTIESKIDTNRQGSYRLVKI